jgi:hypothetical protein
MAISVNGAGVRFSSRFIPRMGLRPRRLTETANNVELRDLRIAFTTVICTFESLKKSNCSFSKCVILPV